MEQQLLLLPAPSRLPGCTVLGEIVKPNDSSTEDYFVKLEELGWYRVGDGCFTTVYMSPDGDRVIKFANGSGQKATVEAALANPDNPHLPRIFGLIEDTAGYDYAYEAEALEECEGDSDFGRWWRRWKPSYGSWKWGPNGPMKEAIRALCEAAETRGCSWDCHRGNVMFRPSTGDLVLNDLLC